MFAMGEKYWGRSAKRSLRACEKFHKRFSRTISLLLNALTFSPDLIKNNGISRRN
jgi:hypothetical protein